MRRVRFRKDTIFRLYLFVLLFASIAAMVFCFSMQARFYRVRVGVLESRISVLEAATNNINSVSVSEVASSPETASTSSADDMYWIEGTGSTRNWWYMDVSFYDGHRARYYLHLPVRKGELSNFHRRFMHDCLVHYVEPAVESEESSEDAKPRFNLFGS